MQLFTRNVMMAGAPGDYLKFATDMAAYVSDKAGREIALWSNVFGAPNGSMTYAVRVEGIADLQATTAKLMEDAGYHAKLAEGQKYVGGPSMDSIGQPIHGELGDHPPVGSFVSVTTASMANGRYMDAVQWGVEIAQHVEKLSGLPTMFMAPTYGGFADLVWIMVAPDAAAVDAATAKVNGDPDYLTSVNGAGDLFIPNSGHQSLATRIA